MPSAMGSAGKATTLTRPTRRPSLSHAGQPWNDAAARLQALGNDFDAREPGPRCLYQLLATHNVLLEDDHG
jgi:hypothetical protein